MIISEMVKTLQAEGYVCELHGDPEVEISGFADPSDYRAGAVIWLGDMKYLKLKEGQSFQDIALLMCEGSLDGWEEFPNVLVCDDPRNAFIRLMELAETDDGRVGIHPSAVVDPDTIIGERVYIGPNVVIGKDVIIGDDCRIFPGVVIEHTTMGNRCSIYPNCVIGAAAFGYRKEESLVMEPHIGRVVLGDDVDILSASVVDRGTTKDTVVGCGTKVTCLTNIGHNVTIGKNCQINGGKLHGFTVVGDDTEIICSIVANRITIGKNVKIGLNSTVVRDIPDDVVAFGSPARIKRGGASTNI